MSPAASILSSLGVFDAVARLGSFSAAGEALNISQSAVSHRIKQLEANVGLQLIRRTTRQLELTPDGARLAQAAANALAEVSTTLDSIEQEKNETPLTISALSSLAVKWLVSHLGDYNDIYPDKRVYVLAEDSLANLKKDPVDVALRFARAPTPGLHSTHLTKDWLVPVASPSLFQGGRPPETPDELLDYPMLADITPYFKLTDYTWENWFHSVGCDITPRLDGLQYNRADMMIQSAIDGRGIALGRAMLLERDLGESGQLIQVGKAIRCKASYYIVSLAEKAEWAKVANFRDWLRKEMLSSYNKITALLDK